MGALLDHGVSAGWKGCCRRTGGSQAAGSRARGSIRRARGRHARRDARAGGCAPRRRAAAGRRSAAAGEHRSAASGDRCNPRARAATRAARDAGRARGRAAAAQAHALAARDDRRGADRGRSRQRGRHHVGRRAIGLRRLRRRGTPRSQVNKGWWYSLKGYVRAPMRLSLGPHDDQQPGLELHSPPRVPGQGSGDWTYLALASNPDVNLYVTVGNSRVSANVIMSANQLWDAGFMDLDQLGGISQAYVTLKFPEAFGNRGGIAATVGALLDALRQRRSRRAQLRLLRHVSLRPVPHHRRGSHRGSRPQRPPRADARARHRRHARGRSVQ